MLTAPLKTALSEISSSDGISLISFLFSRTGYFIAHLKVNRRQKPQNKNTESPLIGKQRRRVAQAICPKTERLNTMSAQRCLFCTLLYSRIHFKKSIVRKVRISTFFSFYLCSPHFCFHDLLTTLFSPNFMHVIHAKCEKIRANSIRNQIKELTLGRIRNNLCLCNITKSRLKDKEASTLPLHS